MYNKSRNILHEKEKYYEKIRDGSKPKCQETTSLKSLTAPAGIPKRIFTLPAQVLSTVTITEIPKNDGNILIQFTNKGTEQFQVEEGERIAQGIFLPYFLTDDDEAEGERQEGMGSTGN